MNAPYILTERCHGPGTGGFHASARGLQHQTFLVSVYVFHTLTKVRKRVSIMQQHICDPLNISKQSRYTCKRAMATNFIAARCLVQYTFQYSANALFKGLIMIKSMIY